MGKIRQRAGVLALWLAALLGSLLSAPAHSAMKETWYRESEPSWDQIRRWKPLAPGKTLRLRLETPPSIDLVMKLKEAGFSRVQILSANYPTPSSVGLWKELAEEGVEMVAMVGSLPTPAQIRLFNEIRFSRTIFVLTRYLEYRQENVFLPLEAKYDLHFALNRYPQFTQKFPIADLPLEVGIEVTVDYWPRYVQMDVLNLIPQMKQLRVQSIPLSSGSIPYLRNLKNMREIVFESDFEPPQSQWEALEQFPLRWILKSRLPSDGALEQLSRWTARGLTKFRMTLDLPRRPSPEEETRYSGLPFDVEWTADAP